MPTTPVAVVDVSALALGPLDIALRMFTAMLIGAVIGTEREYTHRPAGMRTHMLVALGACAVMTTSQLIFWQYRVYGATPDPARLSAQVITTWLRAAWAWPWAADTTRWLWLGASAFWSP